MVRTINNIGLLVGALLMLGGLTPGAANAHVPARFTMEQAVTTFEGEPAAGAAATRFRVTGQEVSCGIVEVYGGLGGVVVEHIAVTPVYTECTAFGSIQAKVTGFGHYGEAVEGEGPPCYYTTKARGKMDLVCPGGKDVTIDAGPCVAHIPAQKEVGTIKYTAIEREGKDALVLHLNLTAITVTHTDLNFLCPFVGSGEVATAELLGTEEVWGYDPESGIAVGVRWDATVP